MRQTNILLFLLGSIVVVVVTINAQTGDQLGHLSAQPAESNETLERWTKATTKIVQNITRRVPMEGNETTFYVCDETNWVNAINLTLGTNNNVMAFSPECRNQSHGKGGPALHMASNTTTPKGKTEKLICQSESGSFAIGILAHLKNRKGDDYSVHMIQDLQLICGGKPEIENSTYHWRMACMPGTAMCGVRLVVAEIDKELYTTGVTISCCAVPEVFMYSAAILVFVPVGTNAPLLPANTSNPDFRQSVCMGGDFLHNIYIDEGKHYFVCGTLLTKQDQYPLLDIYNNTLEKLNILVRIIKYGQGGCEGIKIMTGVAFEDGSAWKPICAPEEKQKGFPYHDHVSNEKKYSCPPGHGMCGIAFGIGESMESTTRRSSLLSSHSEKEKGPEHFYNIICCSIELNLCSPTEAKEELSTAHCTVINADTICTVEYKIGLESIRTQTKEEVDKSEFKTTITTETKTSLKTSTSASAKAKASASARAFATASGQASASSKFKAVAVTKFKSLLRLKNVTQDEMMELRDMSKQASKDADKAIEDLKAAGDDDKKIEAALLKVEAKVFEEEEYNDLKEESIDLEGEVKMVKKMEANARAEAGYDANTEVKAEKKYKKAEKEVEPEPDDEYETDEFGPPETTETNVTTKTVTASFRVPKGGRLVAYQRVISCGDTKNRLNEVISVVIPSTICEPRDELVEFFVDRKSIQPLFNNVTNGTSYWNAKITATGVGLHWNKRPREMGMYSELRDVSASMARNFYENVKMTPSAVTGFDWTFRPSVTSTGDIEKSDEWQMYKPEVSWDETVNLTSETEKMRFYRVVGKCGDDWVIAAKGKIVARPYTLFPTNTPEEEQFEPMFR